MTNGEKIKEIFPNIIKYGNILIDDTGALQKNILFDDIWWNAEYKEPTTKNDLGVDWESYKDADGNSLDDLILEVLKNNFDCGNTYGYKVADEIIELLPSVTPQEPTNNDLTCAYAKGVYDTREETATIFDKIRAEIEAEPYISKMEVLDIIDKYKAESEET